MQATTDPCLNSNRYGLLSVPHLLIFSMNLELVLSLSWIEYSIRRELSRIFVRVRYRLIREHTGSHENRLLQGEVTHEVLLVLTHLPTSQTLRKMNSSSQSTQTLVQGTF